MSQSEIEIKGEVCQEMFSKGIIFSWFPVEISYKDRNEPQS